MQTASAEVCFLFNFASENPRATAFQAAQIVRWMASSQYFI